MLSRGRDRPWELIWDPTASEGLAYVLLRVSMAVKKHQDHGNSYKEKYLIKVEAHSFRDLVHYHHGQEHAGMQADMVLEKGIFRQQEIHCHTGCDLSIHEASKPACMGTFSSNTATSYSTVLFEGRVRIQALCWPFLHQPAGCIHLHSSKYLVSPGTLQL